MSEFLPDEPRHRAIRIALFNHKGGVGKTTLTVNIAATLAREGHRVLAVDSDPQCNLTSFYLDDGLVDELLSQSDSKTGLTLWSAVKPVYDSDLPPKSIVPQETTEDDVYLLPGDIQLSKFESDMESAWTEAFQRKPRGYNTTIALSKVVNDAAWLVDCDVVFYDCGPNVGGLNRAILLDCDYFIIPGACDQYSVRALTTLGIKLVEWIKDWKTINLLVPDGVFRMPGLPKLMGYIVQRFRMYRKVMARQFALFADRFERELNRNIYGVLRNYDVRLTPVKPDKLQLGSISDFAGRAVKSQAEGRTLDLIGSPSQRGESGRAFRQLAKNIAERIGL